MKKATIAAFTLGTALAFAPFAQASEALRNLSVTGEASASVQPDQAQVTLGVRAQAREAGDAMGKVSEQLAQVMDSLAQGGVEGADIRTDRISLNPVWSRPRNEDGTQIPQVVGFEAANLVTVTFRDLEAMGEQLDRVLSAGANDFNGLSFSYSGSDLIETELRAAAMKNAMQKAQELAEAAEMELGHVREIRDGGSGGAMPIMAMEKVRRDSVPVAPGSITLSYSVSASFDLEVPTGEGN